MEKISSILPGNARIRTVDLDEAHLSRPGAPNAKVGQARGTTASERDKITISSMARENALREINEILHPQEAVGAPVQTAPAPASAQGSNVNESLAELSGAALNKYA